MPLRNVLFIVNRYSGDRFQPSVEGRILDLCERHDAECTLWYTEGPGHATKLAQEGVLKKFDAVVAVGGDGTINEVGKGLLHTSTLMGVVPKGSGNGLARHLGIPLGVTQATRSLFDSEPVAMDTLSVNTRLSMNVSGIGFDGHIANRFGREGHRGWFTYTRLVFSEYGKYGTFEADIQSDGQRVHLKDAFVIAIANSSQYGNNITIAPRASICDHRLHLAIFRKMPLYRLDLMYSFFNKSVGPSSFCQILESDAISIKLPAPIDYHVDGEACGKSDSFEIKTQPASLSILVPHRMIHFV